MFSVLTVLLVILAQQFVEIVINSCLIDGIRKNRRGLLVPWVIMHVLYVIVELGLIVLFITVIVYLTPLYKVRYIISKALKECPNFLQP